MCLDERLLCCDCRKGPSPWFFPAMLLCWSWIGFCFGIFVEHRLAMAAAGKADAQEQPEAVKRLFGEGAPCP